MCDTSSHLDGFEQDSTKYHIDISDTERALIEAVREYCTQRNWDFDYMTALAAIKKISEINPHRSGGII